MTTTTGASTPVIYTQHRFLFETVDPVHVGTGGYRLGRVDMSIVREPGSNVPKVPGTTLAGAARSYAAVTYGKLEAAGQHRDLTAEQKVRCPIIYAFGTATDESGGQAGTVNISDARILAFPVPSLEGPVWVSTGEVLRQGGFNPSCEPPDDTTVVTSLAGNRNTLNLGWLLLDVQRELTLSAPQKAKDDPFWARVSGRIVLVTPKIFTQVVNSNLEVRTSVSIDPETGAAESGLLFTYEAIPRATWLWCDVVIDDYRRNKSIFPVERKYGPKPGSDGPADDNQGEKLTEPWDGPLDVVKAGAALMEHLGVGGMGTRGFGRLRLGACWNIQTEAAQ